MRKQEDADRYLIGEVSVLTGISKDTLHFYEKSGLLKADYTDPDNHYRYYSRRNLWQLDIINVCRKLRIPLKQVKQLLSLKDNRKITGLLLEYREEALAQSAWYQQIADDISWYAMENEKIENAEVPAEIEIKHMDARTAIAGADVCNPAAYHADLQKAAQEELKRAGSIRRKYGYVLDPDGVKENRFIKQREYLILEDPGHGGIQPKCLLTIPAGEYAVFLNRVRGEVSDFTELTEWMSANHRTAKAVYAEEVGLQLFDYIDEYICEIYVLI